jgi:uncharacterized repeat protein (TIGR01451 family)
MHDTRLIHRAHRLLSLAAFAAAACAGDSPDPDLAAPAPEIAAATAALGGTDGAVTVAAANTVLNQYAVLATNAAVGATSITVTNIADLTSPTFGALATGDLLLIAQMQGATIDTTDTANYGTVTALGSAGRYELCTVGGVAGNVITFASGCTLRFAYTTAGRSQVVRVPQPTSLTVNAGASVVAPAWDGVRGGIVAVHVQGTATVSGSISASAAGFRGGGLEQNSALPGSTIFRSTAGNDGAEKGEGIAGSVATYDGLGGRFGRGAPANGGGGGDSHNAGGGGGANGNNAATYTGAGVMDGAAVGAAAWALDSDFIANGNALTTSSGGGRGGYTYSANNQNALTTAPGNAGWGGDNRRQVGGRGGRPLDNDPAAGRLFMGGGGGAGDSNNNQGGVGGRGGGVVLLIANTVSGSGTIQANGGAGQNTAGGGNNDAPGGGGGGGSVVVFARTLAAALNLQARGGAGGNQLAINTEAEGPGGGGGGGFIAVSGGTPTRSASGGAAGSSASTAVTEFPINGGTGGAAGVANAAVVSIPSCFSTDLSITVSDGVTSATPGTAITYTIVVSNASTDVLGVSGATVADTFPASLSGVSWTCSASAGSTCPASGTGNINASVNLLPGGTTTFTVNATIVASATGSLANTATVTAPAGISDPTPGNNSATDTDTLTPSANLSVTVSDSPDPVAEDALLTYTVTAANAGPSDAATITATFALPAGSTFGTANGTGWTCSQSMGTVTCTRAAIAAGATAPAITITCTPTVPGTATGSAAVSAATADPVPGNNGAQATTTVSALNDPPVNTVPGSLTTAEDTTAMVNGISVADPDLGASDLKITLTVTSGSLTMSTLTGLAFSVGDGIADATMTFTGSAAAVNAALASLGFAPTANVFGAAVLTITSDDQGATGAGGARTDQDTIAITITSVNDPPTANPDSATVAEDAPATAIAVLGNDSFAPDVGEVLLITLAGPATHGTVTITGGGTGVTYQPSPNYNGPDSFSYTISDQNGGSATTTVSITVTSVNDVPAATADSATVVEDGATDVPVLGNDSGLGDGPVTVTITTPPTHGTATVNPDGSVHYTPAPDYNGPDSFGYTVTDGDGQTATATVSVTVTPVNDPPVAAGDAAATDPANPVTIPVLGNDTDADGDTLSVASTSTPAHGSVMVNANGTITYTPMAGYMGVDTFDYTVSDGKGGTATGTVTIDVGLDDDMDGLSNLEEMVRGTDPKDPDSDDDGIKDGPEVYTTMTDPKDDDTDDDGLLDGTEDADKDGVVDPGETGAKDGDSDDDGIQDGTELGLATPEGKNTNPGVFLPDADPTTTTDPEDADSDDDGLSDGAEDADKNGQRQSGETDPRDADSDDDGLFDGTERGVTTAGPDTDVGAGHFIPDADPATTTNPLDADTDDGSVSDGAEDTDKNGRVDAGERNPNDPSDDVDDDRDGDGIVDGDDNCPDTKNADQRDQDGDGVGDACDPDADGDGFADDLGLSGGGCRAVPTGGAGPGGWAALGGGLIGLSLAGVARRRRRRARALIGAPIRRALRAVGLATIALVGLAGLVAAPGAARAQAQAMETQGYPVERARISLDADGVFDVEWGAVPTHKSWAMSLWLGDADDPLVAYRESDGDRVGVLVGARIGGSLAGYVALWNRVQLGLEIPLIVYQSRPEELGMTQLADVQSFGLGDLRFVPKLQLLRSGDHGLDLALVASLTVPSGGGDNYFGEDGLSFAPELAVSRAFGPIRLAGNLGYRVRPATKVLNLVVDDEIFTRAGAGYRFGERGGPPLELDLTLGFATGASDLFGARNRNAAELMGQAAWDLRGPLLIFAGGGLGLNEGFGTPDWRVLVGVRFADRREDPDGDGLFGVADACPTEPEDKDEFEDQDGCADPDNDDDQVLDVVDGAPLDPEDRDDFEDQDGVPDPDNDKDGIADAKDRCPLEAEIKNGAEDDDGCPDEIDGDGLADAKDRCPREPEDKDGFEDDDGCPELDDDQDGVVDARDTCPREAGPAANLGCPDKDRDADTVVDREDNCPDEPGQPEYQGCRRKQMVVIREGGLDIIDAVYFDTNKAVIQRRSYGLLDNVAQVMLSHPEIPKFRVEGHTDDRGDDDSNLGLSQRRAEAVVAYLQKKGVPAERLEAVGYGETKPIAGNDTKAGRAANRRVVFKILGPDDDAGIQIEQTGPQGPIKD